MHSLHFFYCYFVPASAKWFGTSEQCPQTCFQIPASTLMKSSFKGSKIFSAVQVCLSTKLGDAGLRASKTHSAAAYLSSFFASSSLVETFLRKPCVSIHITSALLQYNQQVSTTNQIHPPTAPTSQKDLLSASTPLPHRRIF